MGELELLHDRYAKALFSCAQDKRKLDKVAADFRNFLSALKENKELYQLLFHPEIDKRSKLQVLDEIAKNKNYCEAFVDFLKLLVKKNRQRLLHGVFLKFLDYYDHKKERIKVMVRTATAFSDEQLKGLKQNLHKHFKRQVFLDVKVEPGLLGGFFIKAEDRIFDNTIAGMLDNLKEKLAG